jgi:rubrerythrin
MNSEEIRNAIITASKEHRTTVYLSSEAQARAKLLPNFSQWVNDQLLKSVNSGGVMSQPAGQPAQEAPKNIQYFCVKCNSWVQTPRCPICGYKTEKREAGELRL